MENATGNPVRIVTGRKWTTLTFAGAAVGMAVVGAAAQGVADAGPEVLWLAQAATTEGGEGGETGAALAEADETVDILVRLSKIDAHILTGLDLVAAGRTDAALAQFDTTKVEIYKSVEATLKAHGAPAFDDALVGLSDAAKAGKSLADLQAAHTAVRAGLDAARTTIAPSAKDELAAVLALSREAAEDFAVGVTDGAIAELGEYQDARAYLLAARETLTRLSASDDAVVKKAAEKSAEALDGVIAALPDVAPEGIITADAGLILAAAAKVELALYPVK